MEGEWQEWQVNGRDASEWQVNGSGGGTGQAQILTL